MKEIFWAFKTLLLFQTHKEVGEGKLRIPFIIAGILMSITIWTGVITMGFIIFHKIPQWAENHEPDKYQVMLATPPKELSDGAIAAMILAYLLVLLAICWAMEYIRTNIPTKKQ